MTTTLPMSRFIRNPSQYLTTAEQTPFPVIDLEQRGGRTTSILTSE